MKKLFLIEDTETEIRLYRLGDNVSISPIPLDVALAQVLKPLPPLMQAFYNQLTKEKG